jgi:NitT/TauT family transport system permease protein
LSDTSRLRPAALRALYPVLAVAVVIAVWQGAVVTLGINQAVLPAPTQVLSALVGSRAALVPYSEVTLVEILVGFGLGVVIGVPLGALIVFSDPVRRAVYPLLVASQMVPKVAIAPVFVVWFGTGLPSKFLVAFLISFFPIVVSTALGMGSADPDMVRLLRSMGAGRLFIFTRLRLPAALPSIFAGLKVAMSLAVVGAIVGEFVAANSGLGYFLLFANGQLDTPAVFAGLVVLTAIGVVLYFLVEAVERLLVPAQLRRRAEESTATM